MLQLEPARGGWVLRWNEIQICPIITDVTELISLHQQLTLLLIALDIQRQANLQGNTKTD